MDVTITKNELLKVQNLTKALRKAKFEELYGDELAAFAVSMLWVFEIEQKLKVVEAVTKPKETPDVVKPKRRSK